MEAAVSALVSTLETCTGFFEPRFVLWAVIGLLLDVLIGDPVFRLHPIRLLGDVLSAYERLLFRVGATGYVGGVILFLLLVGTIVPLGLGLLAGAATLHPWALDLAAGLILWACFALRDLLAHGERVARAVARGDEAGARTAIAMLVGRDTERMDTRACGRAAVESLSENLVDGVLSPLLYAVAFGPLGAVIFKIISTMDSMVGYKTPRYLRFGWCGARLDDVANFPVARWSAVVISGLAALLPGCSAGKAWRSALAGHALVPGPNSGWPEAATAGAIQRRLIGPIYKNGALVCDVWLGDPDDPVGADAVDLRRTYRLIVFSTAITLALGAGVSLTLHPRFFL
jgi:adenosylcobinamide-phosphate synthase